MSTRKIKTRAHHAKVSSGCITCKGRHVKCDETRPECLRCMKLYGSCKGYAGRRRRNQPQILPRPSHATPESASQLPDRHSKPRLLMCQPSQKFLASEEDRYFHHFCSRTGPLISGYFASELWNRLLLQMCHSEAYVKYAILAIGALDKTIEATGCSSFAEYEQLPQPHRLDGRQNYDFALVRYGAALHEMQILASRVPRPSLRHRLISTLLTICFQELHGDQETALIHSQSGVKIVNTLAKRRRGRKTAETIEPDLLQTFTRLNFQVMNFRDSRTLDEHHAMHKSWIKEVLTMPETFSSLKQARPYFDLIINLTVTHWKIRVSYGAQSIKAVSFTPAGARGEGFHIMRETAPKEYERRMKQQTMYCKPIGERWNRAFQPVFDRSRTAQGKDDFLGATVIMMLLHSLHFSAPFDENELETSRDQFLEHYKYVVQLARHAVEFVNAESGPQRSVFHFETSGIVDSLFMVATRCRVSGVRREAIELLRQYPRREGVWDSAMAVRIAESFVETEEEGLEEDFVPEERRLRVLSNEFDLSKRTSVLRCSKRVGKERVVLAEKVLTW